MKIYSYKKPTLITPEEDIEVPGFVFTKGDFEDLIDNFTPFEDIPVLLCGSHAKLDEFCMFIYNMPYKETYEMLIKRAGAYFRKSMLSLSKAGNPTAIKVSAEYYVGLGAVDKQAEHITFVGIMPNSESDAEKLSKDKLALDKYEGGK